MKNFLSILFLSFVLIVSCAKPTVVNVVLPNDKDLTCEQLETSVTDAQEFRRKAKRNEISFGKINVDG